MRYNRQVRRTNISKNNRIVDPFEVDKNGNDISDNSYVQRGKKTASPEALNALQKALLDLENKKYNTLYTLNFYRDLVSMVMG